MNRYLRYLELCRDAGQNEEKNCVQKLHIFAIMVYTNMMRVLYHNGGSYFASLPPIFAPLALQKNVFRS